MLGAFHEASGGQLAIRLARQVSQSPGDIWPFVTGPAKLPSRLFPAQIDLTGSAGTDLSFVFPDGRAPNFTGQILTSNHPTLLECSWGAEVRRVDLAPIPQDGTDLLFTNISPSATPPPSLPRAGTLPWTSWKPASPVSPSRGTHGTAPGR